MDNGRILFPVSLGGAAGISGICGAGCVELGIARGVSEGLGPNPVKFLNPAQNPPTNLFLLLLALIGGSCWGIGIVPGISSW